MCKNWRISYLTDNSVNSGITVYYNGTRISFHSYGQNPELLASRTLVPLRSIFEAMGADVDWDNTTSTAIAKRNKVEIRVQIGANEIYKDGKSIPVDVPAQLLNDRTMVPVRVIAEAFGADVQWNENGKCVLITE
ncbi:MAG: copper amine oxidase N-terminal domain-containing protein [Clostridia bacterium]|nr:copper amine oxidase N-terminal domain-containing protein [Clostridia bacterium]